METFGDEWIALPATEASISTAVHVVASMRLGALTARGYFQNNRGQTGRSTYERMKEHFSKWESKDDDSILHKHAMEHHSGEVFEVDVKLLTRAFGKPSTRMIAEAVEIEELPDENSLNSKLEWTFVKLPRVDVI